MGDRQAARLGIHRGSLERALSPPSPQRELTLARFASQRRGGFNQQAEDDGAIVAGQLDEVGLSDESTKLDQLMGAFAALHLPRPRVMPRPLRLQAIARLHRSSMRRPRPA